MKLEHILLNGWLRGNLLYWRVTWSDYTPNHNIQREITRSFCKGLLLSHFKMQYSDKRKSFQDQCGLVTFQESVDFTGYEIHASWSHQLQSLNGDHAFMRQKASSKALIQQRPNQAIVELFKANDQESRSNWILCKMCLLNSCSMLSCMKAEYPDAKKPRCN